MFHTSPKSRHQSWKSRMAKVKDRYCSKWLWDKWTIVLTLCTSAPAAHWTRLLSASLALRILRNRSVWYLKLKKNLIEITELGKLKDTSTNDASPKLLFVYATALHGVHSRLFGWKEIIVTAEESTTSTVDSKVLGDTIERVACTDTHCN